MPFTKQATNDTAQITAMFIGEPRNFGIWCGPSRLLVVDEDDLGCFER